MLYYWDDYTQKPRPTTLMHLRALDMGARGHRVQYHNIALGIPLALRLFTFDAIILHTSLLCQRWCPTFSRVKHKLDWLRQCDSVKIALPQDEYDHAEFLDAWLDELGIAVVYTNFEESSRSLLYPRLRHQAHFVKCLTGYMDEKTGAMIAPSLRPMAERPLDLVYRARQLPYWFGSHGQLKHEIASEVLLRARSHDLRCDISTRPESTITGNDWFNFLASARATIGCESGSSVLDARGDMQKRIRALLSEHPGMSFGEVSVRMPPGWDSYRFFALGPRHLEAVMTRTCQILIEGEYDGVLQPHRHYLPLRRDLANLDEVLAQVRDHALLEAIATRAYEEIYCGGKHTYAVFARQIEESIECRAPKDGQPRRMARALSFGMCQALTWLLPSPMSLLRKWLGPPVRMIRAVLRKWKRRQSS